jgi:NTE family protein
MAKPLAFALSGGGSRGALQVGALYALQEAGLEPDLLIGVSIGAVNAAFLALHGFSKASIDRLVAAWHESISNDLMPANYLWLTLRAMVGRSSIDPSRRLKEFFISNGLAPEISFSDIQQPRLVIVSTDLNNGKPILHGDQADDNVLEALLLSTALPPWFMPVRKQDQYLMDGGIVSSLPVEPAMHLGATGVVALDLLDKRDTLSNGEGVRGFLDRLIYSIGRRNTDLELELAEARSVPILYFGLTGKSAVPIWDFKHTDELITTGYEIARRIIEQERSTNPILAS